MQGCHILLGKQAFAQPEICFFSSFFFKAEEAKWKEWYIYCILPYVATSSPPPPLNQVNNFCWFKPHDNAIKIQSDLTKVYGKPYVLLPTVNRWIEHFSLGNGNTSSDHWAGWSVTVTDEQKILEVQQTIENVVCHIEPLKGCGLSHRTIERLWSFTQNHWKDVVCHIEPWKGCGLSHRTTERVWSVT